MEIFKKISVNFYTYLIFLLPLIGGIDYKGFSIVFNVIQLKITFYQIFLFIGLLLYLTPKIFTKTSFNFHSHSSFKPLYLFLSYVALSFFWSISSYDWLVEFIDIFTLFVGFIFFYNLLKDKYFNVESLLKLILLSLFITSVVIIIQTNSPKLEFLNHLNFYYQFTGPSGSFGNKNFAANFIIITLPLAIFFYYKSENKFQLTYYFIVVFLSLIALSYIGAKQSLLTLALLLVALFIFNLFNWRFSIKNHSFTSFGFTKFFSIVFSVYIAFSVIPSSLNIDTVKNTLTNESIQSSSSKRIPLWVNSMEMLKENPLLGVGAGQWGNNYIYYYDKLINDTDSFSHHHRGRDPHNVLVLLLTEYGLVGFSLIIWFLILSLKTCSNVIRSHNNEKILNLFFLLLGVLSFVTVSMFTKTMEILFPVYYFLIYIALIVSLSPSNNHSAKAINNEKFNKSLYFIIIAITPFIIAYGINKIHAHYEFYKAFEVRGEDKLNKQLAIVKKAYSIDQDNHEVLTNLSDLLMKKNQNQEAIIYLNKTLKNRPTYAVAYLNLATAYENIGEIKKAIEVLRKFLLIDPKDPRATVRLLDYEYNNQNLDGANILYKRLKRSFEMFKNRKGYKLIHPEIVNFALAVGDYKYVDYIYEDYVKKKPTAENFAIYGVLLFNSIKDYDRAREVFLKAIDIDPNIKIPKKIISDLKL